MSGPPHPCLPCHQCHQCHLCLQCRACCLLAVVGHAKPRVVWAIICFASLIYIPASLAPDVFPGTSNSTVVWLFGPLFFFDGPIGLGNGIVLLILLCCFLDLLWCMIHLGGFPIELPPSYPGIIGVTCPCPPDVCLAHVHTSTVVLRC